MFCANNEVLMLYEFIGASCLEHCREGQRACCGLQKCLCCCADCSGVFSWECNWETQNENWG